MPDKYEDANEQKIYKTKKEGSLLKRYEDVPRENEQD